jgi:branched-subunit amino acid aminotransferase/4-amino-4-deoxychorismate lyase
MSGFQLIETMRVLDGGEVYLLDRHLNRLSRSARHFGFDCDLAKVREAISVAIPAGGKVSLRLLLSQDGSVQAHAGALPGGYVERLKVSTVRVDPGDPFLYHKTTNRGIYEAARRECDDKTDVILVNERGEITETPIMNVAVFRTGQWVTPALSCGLLPGIMREELLCRGEIVEGVVRPEELRPGEQVRCFNALRGVFDLCLQSGM